MVRYGNNCICSDHCKNDDECESWYKQDVAALLKYAVLNLVTFAPTFGHTFTPHESNRFPYVCPNRES